MLVQYFFHMSVIVLLRILSEKEMLLFVFFQTVPHCDYILSMCFFEAYKCCIIGVRLRVVEHFPFD